MKFLSTGRGQNYQRCDVGVTVRALSGIFPSRHSSPTGHSFYELQSDGLAGKTLYRQDTFCGGPVDVSGVFKSAIFGRMFAVICKLFGFELGFRHGMSEFRARTAIHFFHSFSWVFSECRKC